MLIRTSGVLSLFGIFILLGCGTGPITTVSNQAPQPAAGATAVSIAFKGTPPSSIFINATPQLTAVVSNDPLNAGVDWLLASCGVSNCGTLSTKQAQGLSLHTQSGQAVTYTPPATLAKNGLAVKILAFATADHSKNLVAPMVINTFSNVLKGSYVLQTSGTDIDKLTGLQDVAQFAGVVVLDGNGAVTGGEQTYTNTSRSVSDPITGGSYFVGADGRGTLTLNTADTNIGQAGIETFNIVVLSPSQAFILKNDPVNPLTVSNESATGTMDLQTGVAPLSQGYAFVVNGTDLATTLSLGGTSPTGMGGVLNVDSPNTISGTGSISDQYLPAVPKFKKKMPISGTVTNPDQYGAVQFNLTTAFSSTPMQFTGYIVDGSQIKLIETDVNAANATGAATSGVAVAQGSATGTFTKKKTFTGNYVFGMLGQDTSGTVVFSVSANTLTSAGIFTAQAGNLTTGFNEAYFGGLSVNLSDQFQSTCKLDKFGSGRLECPLTYVVNGPGPDLIFYQTGNGTPPLVLDADSNLLGGAGVSTGLAYPISTPASFNGDYGMRLTQTMFGIEADFTGQIAANGQQQSLAGTFDVNTSFANASPTAMTGTFVPSAQPNVLSGTLDNPDGWLVPNASGVGVYLDYYLIDSNHGFLIETDLNTSGSAVAFGYFATRTPVCQGCP